MKPFFWPRWSFQPGPRNVSDPPPKFAPKATPREVLATLNRATPWNLEGLAVCWRRQGEYSAQLQVMSTRGADPEQVACASEFWACIACGRVTRNARNSQAPTSPLVKHYLHCPQAAWRRDPDLTRELGYPVERCDGVDARRYRCGVCCRQYTEADAEWMVEHPDRRSQAFQHRRTCVHVYGHRAVGRVALRMPQREALGQLTFDLDAEEARADG